jgi:hypothetical protein
VAFQNTATRLWKRLTPQERLTAAEHFWKEPPPEMAGSALGALVKARRMRPQAARALADDAKARALALILDPGEPLAFSLLVALHLGTRRPLLGAFLDALGLPHEDGVLKDEAGSAPAPTDEQARAAITTLVSRFAVGEIETYLNTLWLQDPDHWRALEHGPEWLTATESAPPQAS